MGGGVSFGLFLIAALPVALAAILVGVGVLGGRLAPQHRDAISRATPVAAFAFCAVGYGWMGFNAYEGRRLGWAVFYAVMSAVAAWNASGRAQKATDSNPPRTAA